jgi:Family of unknown function (DUF6055)
MRSLQGVILATGLVALALPAGAAASDLPAPAETDAQEALETAEDAIATPGDEEPTRELTAAFAELSQALPALRGEDRRIARRILARPDDGPADRYGDGYSVAEADESPVCDANFCVHWVATGRDKPPLSGSEMDGIPHFVDEVLASADDSFSVENDDLGWIEPIGDDARGGGNGTDKTDVYLIETNGFYFGYSSPDEGQGQVASKQAYLVLDNDYEEFGSIDPIDALQVTMAHEYNHVLQFAYDSLEDGWMFESTATWMENNVYPGIDDYINYVPDFARSSRTPLTSGGFRIYGAAVWNHFLQGEGNADDVRDAWDDSISVTPPHLSVAAYDSALGGTGNPFPAMGQRFSDFATSTAEWRSAHTSLYEDAAELPDMRRAGKLRVGEGFKRIRLDHLAYALLKVPSRAAESSDLKLRVKAPDSTQSGLALIGRRGGPTSGDVDELFTYLADGGTGTVTLPADTFSRVTAAVINADGRLNGGDHYARDNRVYNVKIVLG